MSKIYSQDVPHMIFGSQVYQIEGFQLQNDDYCQNMQCCLRNKRNHFLCHCEGERIPLGISVLCVCFCCFIRQAYHVNRNENWIDNCCMLSSIVCYIASYTFTLLCLIDYYQIIQTIVCYQFLFYGMFKVCGVTLTLSVYWSV